MSAIPPPYDQHAAQAIPLVTPLHMLNCGSDNPQFIDCPFCHRRARVSVRREGTSMQMLTGILLCLLCVCLACLPCCAGWFEETLYSCSECKQLVAKRDDDGNIQVFSPPVLVPSQAYPQQLPPAMQKPPGA
ncbi:hypothetical protein OQA88_2465 [Cercophora sp. LCS_1]